MEKDFIKESEKALKLYQDLTIQRDTVQSTTLAALLGTQNNKYDFRTLEKLGNAYVEQHCN